MQVSVLDVVAHGGAPADASAAERVPEERNTESRARSERVSRLAAPAVATVAEEGTEGNYM